MGKNVLISKIYMFLRSAQSSRIGTVFAWTTSIIGILTPILFVLGVFGIDNFLSANKVEFQITSSNMPTNWNAVETQLVELNQQITRERIVTIGLLLLITVCFILFSKRKLRGAGYRKATSDIHLFNHHIRDALVLIDMVSKGECEFETQKNVIKGSVVKSLNHMAAAFKHITGAECAATIKRLDISPHEAGQKSNAIHGSVRTWLRDDKTRDERRLIDNAILNNNLDDINNNEHFRAIAIPDDNYYIYIPDIRANNMYEKMDSFNAWQLNQKKPQYRAIMMVGISAFFRPDRKNDNESKETYRNIGILYVDCHKPFAFGYQSQQLLHSFSDSLYFVMTKYLDAYHASQP